jgi:zinc finger protein
VAEVEYRVENFGPVLMSVSTCKSCGYKHTDVVSLGTHEPTSTSVKVRSADDLKIRVVRGNTATILVPELGVSIEPGQNNEGFISNIEGVLARVQDVATFLTRSLNGHKKRRADAAVRKIEKARKGRLPFTLVLKDPFGNSAVISNKVKTRVISAKELKGLKFGEHALATRKMQ